jgi:hypothetical protein
VRPPERLLLALVVVDRAGGERRGGAVPRRGRVGVHRQRSCDGAELDRGPGVFDRLAGWQGRDAPIGGEPEQPVAQPQRGDAVVSVVVGDGLEAPPPLGPLALVGRGELRTRLGVLGDGLGPARHPALIAQFVAHVERFELLDRVGARADPQSSTHDRVEVDEHVLAQQLIDLRLAHAVPRGDAEQMGPLVGRVVVDVHARIPSPPLCDEFEEIEQGALLGFEVVRPERCETLVGVDHAEEVVEPPPGRLVRPGLAIHGVALEVEEEVSRVGLRQRGERGGVDDAVGGRGGGARLDLQGGLRREPLEHGARQPLDGDGRGAGSREQRRYLLDRAAPGREQRVALRPPDPRDEQRIARAHRFGLADLAAAARRDPVVGPRDRGRALPAPVGALCGDALPQQTVQPLPARAEHRGDVGDAVPRAGAVSEDQHGLGSDRHADALELLGVGRELHERGRLRPPRELRVLHLVGAVGLEAQEVREADEADLGVVGGPVSAAPVALRPLPDGGRRLEEGGLEHHLCPPEQRLARLLGDPAQRGLAHRLRAGDLDHSARRADDPAAQTVAVAVERALLVGVAESRRPGQHRIVGGRHLDIAPELGVDASQERELARARRGQVARARHDALPETIGPILQEHGRSFRCLRRYRPPLTFVGERRGARRFTRRRRSPVARPGGARLTP